MTANHDHATSVLAAWVRLGVRAIVLLAVVSGASRVAAQIDQFEFRAADGTAYQLLKPNTFAGTAQTRITSIAGSDDGLGGCNLSQGMSGGNAQAVVGGLQGLQVLHPYDQIVRSFVLTPNDLTMQFDSSFGGRLTLGSGGGALTVCKDAFDCSSAPNVQNLVALSSALGGVPAACIAVGVNAGCDLSIMRNTFAFGLAASGSPPTCDNPDDVTVNTAVCAADPADGFVLGAGQAIVFVYDESLAGAGFAIGAAGFGITGGALPPCLAAGQVFNAQASLITAPAPPAPSPTPSPSPTLADTATSTPTDTPTVTPSDTATATSTATATNTPADTATATSTATNTAANTATSTSTATRTPVDTATATPIPSNTATQTRAPSATANSTATRTPQVVEICRTKGFWGAHSCPESSDLVSVCEKDASQNITQQVINAAGGSLSVCGETLTDTHLDHQHSAEEALCVKIEGEQRLQLASQLTAAALNCVITNGSTDCAGVSIEPVFKACNTACANGQVTAEVEGTSVDCIDAIDDFNSNPACEARPLCNESLGLCFTQPGPAGSAKLCNAARTNTCTIFSGAPPCAQ